MERHIVHMDQDAFFVEVILLHNQKLRGQPVIVGGSSDRGVVASCSYEARQFGVHSAMPVRLALQLCPHAVIVKGDMDLFSRHSGYVTEIITDAAPLVEKASIDEHYLDITGMDKYQGCMKWTRELRQKIIKETGLPISFGLSSNKTVSKVATGVAKPSGELQVRTGGEREFLAPLSVRRIPMIGGKTYTLLRNMGIETVGTLQQMPVDAMERVLGDHGVSIWKKANGVDISPVVPYREQKSVSTETTFDKDTTNMDQLRCVISGMVEALAYELRSTCRLTRCVTLKIRYSDFNTYTKQIVISPTSADHVLAEVALTLFEKLYTRRMLIRLIGVKFSQLVSGSYQIDLYDDTISRISLYQAMDRIKNRFGSAAVMRASGLGGSRHVRHT